MSELVLSVVLVSYNMAREIPRTLRSLSRTMQWGMDDTKYEILLVDNGSSEPVDYDLCRQIIPDIKILETDGQSSSPVDAINLGLSIATGELVGVFIDGARMASPGLLRQALDAAAPLCKPVIGTIAFHLGPDVQMKSVQAGYNQAVEDELLESCDWQSDGYRLFGISTLAASSSRGWFMVPKETNALFMRREHWTALGGYDPAFVTRGGGHANHDMWYRACHDTGSEVVMLLGEATFHQVHGGIATNASQSRSAAYIEEYRAIRGYAHKHPDVKPRFYGSLTTQSAQTMNTSIELYQKHAS